ncbi:hypothetical protein [Metabacillus sp. FJAT-52054]|uniref:Uncharacterized protein n=1 Tax=Metabacillus sediminis TaxID=3117746 RepID=A0ABZ2NIC4_9BACI
MAKLPKEGEFPNERDFFYIVSFLIIVVIFIVSHRLSDNTDVVAYVGFAGTIVSILLAVIAIIYSFYQSSTYENSTKKLDITANKIENITNELSEVAKIGGNIADLKGIVEKIDNTVTNIDSNFYEEMNKKPHSSSYNSVQILPSNDDNDLETAFNYDRKYFEKVTSNLTVLAAVVVVWIQKSYKLNVNFNIKDCTRFFVEDIMLEQDKNRLLGFENAINGLLIAYEHLYFFDLKKLNEEEFKVNSFDKNLSDVIDDRPTEWSILEKHFDGIETLIKHKGRY